MSRFIYLEVSILYTMKNYQNYTASDFASDGNFVKWIKNPDDTDLSAQWNKWLDNNPHKYLEIEEAKELVMYFEEIRHQNKLKKDSIWDRIENSIDEEKQVEISKTRSFYKTLYTHRVAASITILLSIFVAYVLFQKYTANSGHEVISKNLNYENNLDQPMTVLLEDGSSVILYKNSRLSIATDFNLTNRRVSLIGKGYFEIKRDEERPFHVETKNIITKVLGTSFVVKAYDYTQALVAVNTGVVSVSKNISNSTGDAVIIKQHEMAAYNTSTKVIERISEKDDLDEAFSINKDFDVRDKPLEEVFNMISKQYGIEIKYSIESIENCRLNASLTGIPIEDKIRLICKGSNLSYKVESVNSILIYGEGCRQKS